MTKQFYVREKYFNYHTEIILYEKQTKEKVLNIYSFQILSSKLHYTLSQFIVVTVCIKIVNIYVCRINDHNNKVDLSITTQ